MSGLKVALKCPGSELIEKRVSLRNSHAFPILLVEEIIRLRITRMKRIRKDKLIEKDTLQWFQNQSEVN